MLAQPVRRSRLMAVLRMVAMTCGAWPVRIQGLFKVEASAWCERDTPLRV